MVRMRMRRLSTDRYVVERTGTKVVDDRELGTYIFLSLWSTLRVS